MAKKEKQAHFSSLLKQGKAFLAKEKLKDAEICFLQAWEKAGRTEAFGKTDKRDLAHIFQLLGRMKFDQGSFAPAVFFLEKSESFGLDSDENTLLKARALLTIGQNEEAAGLAAKLVADNPEDHPARLVLAQALLGLEKFEEAKNTLDPYVAANPQDPEGFIELGLAYEGLGQPGKAQELFDKAKYDQPACFEDLLERADTFLGNNLFSPTRQVLIRAEKAALDDAQNFFDLGLRHFAINFANDAERCFRKAIKLQPQPHFYRELAFLYERANKPEEAAKFAGMAVRYAPDTPTTNLVLARCEKRVGKLDDALARLEAYCEQEEGPNHKAEFQNLIGSILDRKGHIDEAYKAFQASKDTLKTTELYKGLDLEFPYKRIKGMMGLDLEALPVHQGNSQNEAGPGQIAFFIGFPRSGTTLTQQILESHPNITVVEEKHPVRTPIQLLQHFEIEYPQVIQTLTQQHIEDLRNTYLRELQNFVSYDKNTTVVDKLPLYIFSLPLILTLFPEAKIIFGLRHPYGSCLSCLMQHFQLNTSMANLMSMEEITNLYDKTMTLWTKVISERQVDFHYVRYENLIQDLESEARSLIGFLGLEWAPEVLEYAKTAKEKGIISTPSYSQVVQPIYADALEKWRAYEKYFTPYKDRLAPHLDAFGYSG